MSITPVNHRKQDGSPAAIARDVDYALQVFDFYVERLPGSLDALAGARVLELGPGASLGTAALLACAGAAVTVADRFLPAWDEDYHAPFFAALAARLAAGRPELATLPIERLRLACDFDDRTLTRAHASAEELDRLPQGAFDVVLSNAVLEHVGNVPQALSGLARVSRPGGHGVHQVDFRDHRDFARPLEFLTLAAAEFQALFQEVAGECGNRWRPDALHQQLERAGFRVLAFVPDMSASDEYLDDVLPRIHGEYTLDRESLRVISGCFVLRRGV